MKLKRLRLRNFRCFKEEISIDFEDITALVGKNDAGKSTLMDAIDIFLNDIDPDKDDASKNGAPRNLTIICEFTELPDEVILDDVNPTKLSTEFLLNAEERLDDATGSGQGISEAMSLCRPLGTIVLKSTVASKGKINLAPLVINEQMVIGSRCGQFKEGLKMLELYPDMPIQQLITARYRIEEAVAAFERARQPDALKVLLEIWQT